MALTKIGKEGITGVSNASNATFLTATSAEGVTLAGTLAVTGVHTVGNNAVITSEGGAVTPNLVQGLAKEWVNFNGTGTVAISDSYNVSSITDSGTGSFVIVLATAMSNTTFVNCTNAITTIDTGAEQYTITSVNNTSTTQISVANRREDNDAPSLSATDSNLNMVATFGDLA